MSDAKHTPGPWFVLDAGWANDFGEAEYWIDALDIPGGDDRHSLAKVRAGCEEALQAGDSLANARLIAAAPEMLEALEALADDYAEASVGWDHPDAPTALVRAQSAIRKAKGETL